MEENKLKRFNKIFPWYDGLSGDLLFWVVIDTLFLTVVKNFTASQIVSLTSVSMIINILLQVPLLKIIHKIGNTKSVRLGSFLLLISSILLTFGKNYITIVIGKIFYEMAFTFQNMINAVLKNNLELQHKENEYIKYRTKANTIYAAVTMIISFIASIMFNINNYLPMIGCITFCVICFILSWYMVDYSKDDKKIIENNKERNKGKIQYFQGLSNLPAAGLEPARCCHQWILSPPRLPFRQAGCLSTLFILPKLETDCNCFFVCFEIKKRSVRRGLRVSLK